MDEDKGRMWSLRGLVENKLIFTKRLCLICLVVILLLGQYTVYRANNGTVNPEDFASPLSVEDRNVLLGLAAAFIEIVETANLTYFMYGGTLLGSYRHHGIIPWDDDLDFLVDDKERPRLVQLLAQHATLEMKPHTKNKQALWKVYLKRHRNRYRYIQSRPILDVFFYMQNATHIWDADSRFTKQSTFPKDIIFPLVRRPYESYMLLSPCNPRAVLAHHYETENCATRKFSHAFDLPIPGIFVKEASCDLLYKTFPFVNRTDWGNGTSNEVIIGKPLDTAITVRNCVHR